jgi:sterol desaturase/sphingolipid hydroxylase (fatty acid hydroxylase superfamily)
VELGGYRLLMVFPIMVFIATLEALYLACVRNKTYVWRESLVSAAVAIGHQLAGMASAGAIFAMLTWLSHYQLLSISLSEGWSILLLFICVEFFYYWFHRLSHECRWFWATHAVHHSPLHFNLSAAYRLGWTGAVSGAALFFSPLILLGFKPAAVSSALAINLIYQFWLHTEIVPKLGWLEKLINTPANHRVHHGSNPRYLDSNYGGVLMVFDHVFGTYVEEIEADPCRYGLVHPGNSNNPLRVALGEWLAIGRDIRRSKNWRELLGYLFRAPGWSPDRSNEITEHLLTRQQRSLG